MDSNELNDELLKSDWFSQKPIEAIDQIHPLLDKLQTKSKLVTSLDINTSNQSCQETIKETQLIYESVIDIIQMTQYVKDRYSNHTKIVDRLEFTLKQLEILETIYQTILELLLNCAEGPTIKLQQLKQCYKQNSELYILAQSINDVNFYGLRHVNHILATCILSHFIRLGNTYIVGHTNKDEQKLNNELKVYNSYLQITIRLIASAIDMNKSDLMCQDRTSPKWQDIQSVSTYTTICNDPLKLQKSYYNFMKAVRIGHAIVLKQSDFSSSLVRKLVFVGSALWYSVMDRRAEQRAIQHICEMKIDRALAVMGMMEQPGVKHLIKLGISTITTNIKIYIDPVVTPITIKYMEQQFLSNMSNRITNDHFDYVNQSIHNDPNQSRQLFTKDKSKLRIRILCSQELTIFRHDDKYNHTNSSLIDIVFHRANQQHASQYFDIIMIHIHGGGFIASSSGSHESYSREWANHLNIPIFSIDYSLAPQYPYPCAIDDCWQAYQWILSYVSKHFNIIPKKIILAGDSAGGNLCVALTALCIKFGVKIPDGLFLAYPVLELKMNYSPSHVFGLTDFLLSHNLMDLCIDSYTKDPGCHEKDPFRSPNFLSDEIMSHFPNTRLVVGSGDPLLDHSHRLVDQLLRNGREVKIIVYEGMSHGFLNFYLKGGMKESERCIIDSIRCIRELINSKKGES